MLVFFLTIRSGSGSGLAKPDPNPNLDPDPYPYLNPNCLSAFGTEYMHPRDGAPIDFDSAGMTMYTAALFVQVGVWSAPSQPYQ